jgi:hypothetical protein
MQFIHLFITTFNSHPLAKLLIDDMSVVHFKGNTHEISSSFFFKKKKKKKKKKNFFLIQKNWWVDVLFFFIFG